jgi:hypothetical protein
VSRLRHVYALDVVYPEGSREPGWRPGCWSDPAYLKTLTRKQRRDLAGAVFRWPRERMFLSSSGAYGRAGLLLWYGADVEVLPSDPVTWPASQESAFSDDSWEAGDTAMQWSPDFERIAGRQREELAGKIRSGALPVEHALEILGEPEARELAGYSLSQAYIDEAAR